ncbi:MAG: DUF3422 domain-containing protein, partial [Maritimibacter sp.]
LIALLDRHGAQHPPEGANHYFGEIGKYRLKWEQHSEFVTYTIYGDGGAGADFNPELFAAFPEDWLEAAPGQRITSALIHVEPMPGRDEMREKIARWFVPESLAASEILDGAAVLAGDFRIDASGHMRFAVFVGEGTSERRIGRIVTRIAEIETYKTMSMMGYARARAVQPRLGFRFGATEAYEAIVTDRVTVLRERRWEGRQTLNEFMTRRFDPAMRTVKATRRQMDDLATRAIRAGDLLRTRVDVERQAQNQMLLESMDKRADLQLRLQETVEGLSVVAISYYAVSLLGYLVEPIAYHFHLDKVLAKAALVVPVFLGVWLMGRMVRRKLIHK